MLKAQTLPLSHHKRLQRFIELEKGENAMKKKIIMLCMALITLVLEILPYGAVCNFANPDGASFRFTYSYFDLTPFGYANFSPFIVAILTCILIVMIVISLITKKQMLKPILAISAISTMLSMAPLLFGIRYFSIIGAFITITLAINTFIAVPNKK